MKLMTYLGLTLAFSIPAKAIYVDGGIQCYPSPSHVVGDAETILDFWDYWDGWGAASATVDISGPAGDSDIGSAWYPDYVAFAYVYISPAPPGTYQFTAWHRVFNDFWNYWYDVWYAESSCDIAEQLPQVSFSATNGVQEVGKTTHFIGLTGCSGGNVVIVATVDPPVDPGIVSWTNGTAGDTPFQRRVSCGGPGETDVTIAIVGAGSFTAKVHVLTASTPPAAGNDAPKNKSLAGSLTLSPEDFGGVEVRNGFNGVVAPAYNIDPFINLDRWVFRVANIDHGYKMAIQPVEFRINLPTGNPEPFPLVQGFSLQDSHTWARISLATAGLPPGSGPPRLHYWVLSITQAHENFHVNDFYNGFWTSRMGLFETEDVEGPAVNVVFDCLDATTTTGLAAVVKLTPAWNTSMAQRHEDAWMAGGVDAEVRAHNDSNPMYLPIRAAIPNP